MNRRTLAVAVLAAATLASCSSTIPPEKYVATMVALGCGNALEGTPEGVKILQEQGITQEQIQAFRKKMDPTKIMDVTREIATKVAACHGVKLDMTVETK